MNLAWPVDMLVSFFYFGRDETMDRLTSAGGGRIRLIGDSGAFSAHTTGSDISVDAYARWVTRWQEHLIWAASLDVIGDPEASWRNWLALRDDHGLATVPTIHAGQPAAVIDRYAAQGVTFMGLGGIVGQPRQAFRWVVAMMRHARDRHPDMRFHVWGCTGRLMLDRIPAWSADSSYAISSPYRYARVRLFDPRHPARDVYVWHKGAHQHRDLLHRVYGIEPAEYERAVSGGDRITTALLATASVQQYAAWLQRRHNVTRPGHDGTGPFLHVTAAEPRVLIGLATASPEEEQAS